MAETTVKIGDIAEQLNTASRLVVSTDYFWVYAVNGTQGNAQQVKIPAEFVKAYLTASITPTVNSSGNWEIGDTDTGVKAEGVTPKLRGGTEGIEVSYDKGTTWQTAVLYSQMDPDLTELEEAYSKITEGEATRVSNENARKTAETARASAEATRQSQESTRQSNESARKTAESTRESNEATRKTNETTRQSQETTRQNQEATRKTNETTRESNESTRKTNETARVNAEKARASAETARANAETTRQNQETTRQNQESTRQSNESTRKTNETARGNAETARANAESARVTAEKARASAETARANAETARASAEATRQSQFTASKNACDTATADAQDTADHPTYIGTDHYVYKWNKTTKAYVKTTVYVKGDKGDTGDQGDLNTVDISTLTPTSTFQKNAVIGINGTLYRATKATSTMPITLVVQDGAFVTETINGKTAYVVSSETLNDGWEQWTDKAMEYWIESLTASVNGKQDTISDLSTIRTGAGKGATAYQKPTAGIPSTDMTSAVQASLAKADSALQNHQDISGKADKATTLAGYGITDAKIESGKITLGSNSITPLTSHQSLAGKSDTTHTHSVKINGVTKTIAATGGTAVDLGTYLTTHQDITGKADKATTLSGYGITNAYTKTEVNTELGKKQDTISDLATIRSNASSAVKPTDQYTVNGVSYTVTELLQAVASLMAKTIVTQ